MLKTPVTVDPVVKEYKAELESLALAILGQHLWSLRVEHSPNSPPAGCLCRVCLQARKAYRIATGLWPSSSIEEEAMKNWDNPQGAEYRGKIEFNDGREVRSFPTLQAAKVHVWENKLTGWINIEYPKVGDNFLTHETIAVRKGKRRGAKQGTWVPCV